MGYLSLPSLRGVVTKDNAIIRADLSLSHFIGEKVETCFYSAVENLIYELEVGVHHYIVFYSVLLFPMGVDVRNENKSSLFIYCRLTSNWKVFDN